MASHSSVLAWETPWTEEPGGLQSMGSHQSDTTERLNNNTASNLKGFPGGASGKEPACQCRRCKRQEFNPTLGSGRSPGGGNGNPLQCSCLENSWTKEAGRLQSTGSHRVR